MSPIRPLPLAGLALAATLATAPGARALDTWETYLPGASDVDLYVGADGLGPKGAEHGLWANAFAAWGLFDALSMFAMTTAYSDEHLSNGGAELAFGLLGTPLDSDHFDLDVMLQFSAGGPGLGDLGILPLIELNFDLEPDQGLWGLYSRISAPIYGRDGADGAREVTADLGVEIGSYLTAAEGHQILLELHMNAVLDPLPGERGLDLGKLGLGYNVALADHFELITEVSVDLPQDDEDPAFGFMVGFLATLPAGSGGDASE